MYTLTQMLPVRQLLLEQLPALAVSMVIAEMFYKFHSFTLECIAFLLTWYFVDAAVRFGQRLFQTRKQDLASRPEHESITE